MDFELDTEFNVETATRPELLSYAKDVLNLDGINTTTKIGELQNKVRTALGIPVKEEVVVKDSDSWPVIVLASDPTDRHDVQVNVNGRQYLIQRGKEVAVPPHVLEALQHAVQTIYPDQDSMEPVEKHTYPFSVIRQGK